MLKQVGSRVKSAGRSSSRFGVVILATAFLTACISTADWADPKEWSGNSPNPTSEERKVNDAESVDASVDFPTLSSVPGELPSYSTGAVRKQRKQELLADHQSAAYSDEPLAVTSTTIALAPSPEVPLEPEITPVQPSTMPLAISPLEEQEPPPPAVVTMQLHQSQTMGDRPVVTDTTIISSGASQAGDLPPAFPDGEPQGYANIATGQPLYKAPFLTNFSGQTGYQARYRSQSYDENSPGVIDRYSGSKKMLPPGGLIAVLYFDHGSAVINDHGRTVLRDIASFYGQTGGNIMVVGHSSSRTIQTSAVEHRKVNYEISLARAKAVAAALVAQGVPQEFVSTESRADTSPVFHEFMPTGEAGNRRVEVYLN